MAKTPLKKVIVPQMLEVRNPASYETRRYITVLTKARYWSLWSGRWIQAMHSYLIPFKTNLNVILS
jgi:hypothetical protein